MSIRVGINGFGRIGRTVFNLIEREPDMEVVAFNDLADLGDLAYLLKYDSVHGWNPRKIDHGGGKLFVDGRSLDFYSSPEPREIPWGDSGADIVIEATGAHRSRERASGHLASGAKRVIIAAPSDDADGMFVLGVNADLYNAKKHTVVSMASCTTNCIAPVARVLIDEFGVKDIVFTTIHAYTASQSLMDRPIRKRRRGRAAALSVVPTTTGAAGATEKVIPELAGKVMGMAMRVPIPDGSITDAVVRLEMDASIDDVNSALTRASLEGPLAGILRVTDEALVSRDILGDTHSSIVDSESTMMLGNRTVKILAWYDNEVGYSARLVDFARKIHAAGV